MKKITLIIEMNEDGLWGQMVEFPDVFSQGKDLTELQRNSIDAYKLLYERDDVDFKFELRFDLTQFFIVNNYINISSLAERIGINKSLLRQYSRGIKFPSLKQVEKIQSTVHTIGKELLNTSLKPVA